MTKASAQVRFSSHLTRCVGNSYFVMETKITITNLFSEI
jgi:hypothetical protein